MLLLLNSNYYTYMKNKIAFSKYFVTGVVLGAFVLAAVPTLSFAATYAYVNQSGDVATVVANDPNTAIATAPNRAMTSGVLLLKTAADYDIVE